MSNTEQLYRWVKASERLPEIKDGKCSPVHVTHNFKNYGGKEYVKKAVAYYFPDRFKTIEWEDWDDYSPENFPYTEEDIESGCVWLKAGWYEQVDCDNCDEHYWSSPLDVIEWLEPIPAPQQNRGEGSEAVADMDEDVLIAFVNKCNQYPNMPVFQLWQEILEAHQIKAASTHKSQGSEAVQVDVEALAEKEYPFEDSAIHERDNVLMRAAFVKGFAAAQSLIQQSSPIMRGGLCTEQQSPVASPVASHSCTSGNSIDLLSELWGWLKVEARSAAASRNYFQSINDFAESNWHGQSVAFNKVIDKVKELLPQGGNVQVSDTTPAQSTDEPLLNNPH